MQHSNLTDETNIILNRLSKDYFEVMNLSQHDKRTIFSQIEKGIEVNKKKLQELIITEIKFTQKDAEKEIERACKTFALAKEHAGFTVVKKTKLSEKVIIEKRISRGPLLAITPFSSPLSSPAHKIVLGILSGTSILFKPSRFARSVSNLLFQIISTATSGKYVYLLTDTNEQELNSIVSDERIGIISFTGKYETGKKIIRLGGIKKYHMELDGGNSPVIFTPEYANYNDELMERLIDGIMVKNGQRCVSIKHIFIDSKNENFIKKMQDTMLSLKKEIEKDFQRRKRTILGPLMTSEQAQNTESSIQTILQFAKQYIPLIPLRREGDFLFPAMYALHKMNVGKIKNILKHNLPCPVVFIHFYGNKTEYQQILEALKNDYIQSGLQLSIFTNNIRSLKNTLRNLIWGGIIINDIPTFRDEYMSFGGFGRAGLGKEGFFETFYAFTDPQTIVY